MKDREINDNVGAIFSTRRARSYPDILDYLDLKSDLNLTQQAVRSTRGYEADAESIQWPDGKKLRTFTILAPLEELRLRILAGRVAQTIDHALSEGVFSSRLRKKPPGWTIEPQNRAHKRRRSYSEKYRTDDSVSHAIISDVRSYYPSVSLRKLSDGLSDLGADDRTIEGIVESLDPTPNELGLPIGPEASAILGNAYLIDVDDSLLERRSTITRYTDDYLILDRSGDSAEQVLEQFVDQLHLKGLLHAEEKTHLFDSVDEALEHYENAVITYIVESGHELTPSDALMLLKHALEDSPPDTQLVRFILGAVISRRYVGLAFDIVGDARIWEIDPDRSRRFAHQAVEAGVDIGDLLLETYPLLKSDGARMSLLLALTGRIWDKGKGETLRSIAESSQMHSLVRAAALRSLARTPEWSADVGVDLSEPEVPLACRRAAIGSFKHVDVTKALANRLTAVTMDEPSLRLTANWAINA